MSGAGDTVTAWVATALAAGASMREAAHLANYAAGLEVAKAGVATVSPGEVLAIHEERHDAIGRLRRGGSMRPVQILAPSVPVNGVVSPSRTTGD